MNLNQKILGIPLIWLMIIGIASASIIGVLIYANIESSGTYQSIIQARGFNISDGDVNDSITFTQSETDPNLYYLSFPLYENQNDIKYTGALKIVPDGTVTGLTFSEIQRTNNGITEAWLTLKEVGSPTEPAALITTTPTETSFAVLGNHEYLLNFRITTGTKSGAVETIKFKISRYQPPN